ncbi:MAG TPA: enoyl-CoA hydratase/isomerase family protein [Longimicrobiales bacterium]
MISVHYDDGIARLTLKSPPLNILTRDVLGQLRSALQTAQVSPALRVVVLAAEGKHFSAGASVEEHLPGEYRAMLADFEASILALQEFPLPVIAAVQGRCLGGAFELVQAADLIVATDDAQFGQPEIQLGVIAPIACALLAARIGPARAAELLYTGDVLTAQAAAEAGLVARVVPRAALEDEAYALAQRIARHSAAAVRATKAALRAATPESRPAIAAATRVYREELMVTHDALEGLLAFVQKRTPQWSHQ